MKMTRKQAFKKLMAFIIANAPRSFLVKVPELDHFDCELRSSVDLQWQVAWAVDSRICIRLDQEVEISWSSSHKNVARAVACVALYRQVVNFAAMLEIYRYDLFCKLPSEESAS